MEMMSENVSNVIGGDRMIVTPKGESRQVHPRWEEGTIAVVDAIAAETGRSFSETSEMLVKWAIQRHLHERELAGLQPLKLAPPEASKDNEET